MSARFIAIDWSGAKSGERRKMWYAEVQAGRLTRLENGRSRDEVVQHLIDKASRSPHLIAGLDFAFSFPRWFVEDADASSADDVWGLAEQRGESWLHTCEDPFWGREGTRRPDLVEHNRRTEIDATTADSQPKSVFQINGAGAVGTGSIRGMPYLRVLRSAGFSIWPFHEAKLPLIVEIYPRLLTGPVVKSRMADREAYLASGFPEIDGHFRSLAACSEDAFDAAVSAVIMSRHGSELGGLSQSLDPVELLEGRIWWPQGAPAPGWLGDDVEGRRFPFKSGARARNTRAGRGRALEEGLTGMGSRALPIDHPPELDSSIPMSSDRSARNASIG